MSIFASIIPNISSMNGASFSSTMFEPIEDDYDAYKKEIDTTSNKILKSKTFDIKKQKLINAQLDKIDIEL